MHTLQACYIYIYVYIHTHTRIITHSDVSQADLYILEPKCWDPEVLLGSRLWHRASWPRINPPRFPLCLASVFVELVPFHSLLRDQQHCSKTSVSSNGIQRLILRNFCWVGTVLTRRCPLLTFFREVSCGWDWQISSMGTWEKWDFQICKI